MKLSVLIPTHNPRPDFLSRTLAALRAQTLPTTDWELLLIDNRSNPPLDPALVDWHPRGRVITEPKLGLTNARLCGFSEAQGDLLVWSDDDNILAPDYLAAAINAFSTDAGLGAAGGKSIPEYEEPPPAWYRPDLAPLGCRDLGNTRQKAQWIDNNPRDYPNAAPIGAGLVIRRAALEIWVTAVHSDPRRRQFGRTGTALTSGEDNDINLTVLAAGWSLAYLPELTLTHLIPPRRLSLDYQCRIGHATFRDFVKVLAFHGIHPWPAIPRWSAPLRKAKAWLTQKAWRGPAEKIRWFGVCGQIEGRIR